MTKSKQRPSDSGVAERSPLNPNSTFAVKFANFPITGVCRVDLEHSGFDISNVDDATMKGIAESMELEYCERWFWDSLESIAESLNIPKSLTYSSFSKNTGPLTV